MSYAHWPPRPALTWLMGYNVITAEGRRNEATVFAPDGAFLGVYGKEHPTYMRGEESITSGTFPVYDTSLGKLGTIICYDFAFIDSARDVAANGARIIAAPSWDWPAIAAKNYAHPLFRAVENRVTLIKADCGYNSVIIDPYGRIIDRDISPEPNVAILVTDVPLGRSNALQTRLGDWFGWLSLAGMVFFTAFVPSRRGRKRKDGSETVKAPTDVSSLPGIAGLVRRPSDTTLQICVGRITSRWRRPGMRRDLLK